LASYTICIHIWWFLATACLFLFPLHLSHLLPHLSIFCVVVLFFFFPGWNINHTFHLAVCTLNFYFPKSLPASWSKHPPGCKLDCIVFLTHSLVMGLGCQSNEQLQTWRTRVSLIVWNLTQHRDTYPYNLKLATMKNMFFLD
jgi:hypothetical protein